MDLKEKIRDPKNIALMVIIILLSLFTVINQSIFVFGFIILIFMYLISSLSWDIISGYVGYTTMAHSVPFGIGAYTTAIILRDVGTSPFITAPLGGLLAAGTLLALSYPMLRLKGVYFIFGSIFINQIFLYGFKMIEFFGGPEGVHTHVSKIPPYSPLMLNRIFYAVLLLVSVATIVLVVLFRRSKFGMGCAAIRENEDAVGVLGVNATKLKMQAYALSAVPQGIMGGLYAYYNLYIDPNTAFGPVFNFFPIMMTIIGGRRTITGPIIGSIILFTLSQVLRYAWGIEYEGLHLLIFAVVLIIVILVMPEGIAGGLKKLFPRLKFLP